MRHHDQGGEDDEGIEGPVTEHAHCARTLAKGETSTSGCGLFRRLVDDEHRCRRGGRGPCCTPLALVTDHDEKNRSEGGEDGEYPERYEKCDEHVPRIPPPPENPAKAR